MTDYVYRRTRPRLLVEADDEGSYSRNCYHVSTYKVTATYPLTDDELQALLATGAVSYGQESKVIETVEHKEMVECVAIDNGKVSTPAINPYSGKPYKPIEQSYWVYKVRTTCDSGD